MIKLFSSAKERKADREELEFRNLLISDLSLGSTMASIYENVLAWFKIEKENADKGTDYERRFIEGVANFDFYGFSSPDDRYMSEDVLERIFTTTEMCFIPSRMRLLASQIQLRYGVAVTQTLNNRLLYSLISIYGCDIEFAEELIEAYPCLWLLHMIQFGSLMSNA